MVLIWKTSLRPKIFYAKNTVISPNFLVWRFCGRTVSALFWAIRPKLCGNCAFPQNFHTRQLGQITVFFHSGYNNRKQNRNVFQPTARNLVKRKSWGSLFYQSKLVTFSSLLLLLFNYTKREISRIKLMIASLF